MDAIVFTGPTMDASDAAARLDAEYRGPAAQGDVARAVREGPRAIGIIDGYFENVPAVWHKEILWAIQSGIAVYGAASMGALRAAELEPFGMIGVGRIFERYRSGELEDDDEVALLHADARLKFRPLTEPLINVRFTMERAAAEGVASRECAAKVVGAAQSLFYKERDYLAILGRAAEVGVAREDIEALRTWLPAGRIDRKRADAIEMLERMAEDGRTGRRVAAADFHVENTIYWEELRAGAGRVRRGARVLEEEILDEVRLAGAPYLALEREAEFKALGLDAGMRRGVDAERVVAAVRERLRKVLGIHSDEELAQWTSRNDLTSREFEDMVRDEAVVRLVLASLRHEAALHRTNQLRLLNRYAGFRDRALDKKRVLALAGDRLDQRTAQDLVAWYFGRIERPMPGDLSVYASNFGFSSVDAFVAALEREYNYLNARVGGHLRPGPGA